MVHRATAWARLALLLALAALVPSCGGGGSSGGTAAAILLASGVVGGAGGTVGVTDAASPYFGTQVVIPAGALSTGTAITLSVATPSTWGSDVLEFVFGPSGTSFAVPVTVTVKYLQAYLTNRSISDPTTLHVVQTSTGSAAETLGTTAQDVPNHTISAPALHFSGFAALGYSNESLKGDYRLISYYFKDVPQSLTPATGTPLPMPLGGSDEVGTLAFDGAGNVSFSTTYNFDGSISSSSGSTTYSIVADGTFTLGNLTGSVLAGGTLAVFGATSLTAQMNVAIKKSASTFSNASVTGTYEFISYYFKDVPQSSTPATGSPLPKPLGGTDEVGTLTFDGSGNVGYSTTLNVDGTITTPSGSTTYSVAADGTFTLGNLTGTVLEGGSAIIFGATSLTPQINIAVRKLGTFDNASLNGTYTFVSYYFKDVPQSSTPATGTPLPMPLGGSDEVGTLTFDGAGNVSYSTTYNVDGTITSSSGSTTYSVASDGTFTLGNLTGIVLEGGSVVAFGATSLTPQINLAIRR